MTDKQEISEQDHPRLFGSSGVRGVFGDDLSEELCLDVARALGSTLPPHSRVCIATDSRLSRNAVSNAVADGLRSTGLNVTMLGILPTPALAFLTRKLGFDTGIMITASHNPPQFNGIKLFNADCIGYSRAQEKEIEQIYAQREFRNLSPGSIEQTENAEKHYAGFLADRFPAGSFKHNSTIVVDAANGAAAGFASKLFSRVGLDVLPLNDTPDGHFPGRDPEPKEDTLQGTYKFMRQNSADFAVCFDGDADRVVFMDKEGFIGFNEAVAYISRLAIARNGRKKVAATVETGNLTDLAIRDLGAEVVRGRVGDVYVAHLVRELNAAIGIEPVGVYIMPETGLYPDSMLAALTLLSSINDPGDIRSSLDKVPPLYSMQEKIPCPNTHKMPVMEAVKQGVAELNPRYINSLDGLRLEFDGSWLLIRASGTEPLIRVNAESCYESETKTLLKHGVEIVKSTVSRLAE